jgi:hypothetical protein
MRNVYKVSVVFLKGRYLGEQSRTEDVIKRDLRAIRLGAVDWISIGNMDFEIFKCKERLLTIDLD